MSMQLNAATSLPPTVAGTQADPRLTAFIQTMPADQQAQALAELQAMTPQQQEQLAAQLQNAGVPLTPTPQAGVGQATLGASVVEPPSTVKTILKNVGVFGGLGAALGFGASFFTLPVVGQVAAPIAAAVGGGVGAVVGLVKGIMNARKQNAEYQESVAMHQQALQAPTVPDATTEGLAQVAEQSIVDEEPPVKERSTKRYTVKNGDTLSAIAKRHDMPWQELYEANKSAVGSNPNMIHPGLKLKIPS